MKEKKQDSQIKVEKRKLSLPDLSKYPRLTSFLNLLLGAVLLSICIVVSYRYWTRSIGDGAYKYSDETYEHIEEIVATCAIPDAGLDRLPLQKELTKFVDTFENQNTELFCLIRDGYFRAEVTVDMDENCNIINSRRNYNSLQEYMDHYWLDLGFRVLSSALGAFIVLEGAVLGSISLFTFASKKIKRAEANASSSKETSASSTQAVESA